MSDGIRPVEAIVPHRVKRLSKEKREEKDDGFGKSMSQMAQGEKREGQKRRQPVAEVQPPLGKKADESAAAPEPEEDEREDEDEDENEADDSAAVGRNLDVRT